ncbi:MAG: hypothetical protein JKX73_09715 [Flavobacteriales bacterium]|nr:hypothetical protein [Flavobacteriales bacterium]
MKKSSTLYRLFIVGLVFLFVNIWFAPSCTYKKDEILVPEFCDTIHNSNPNLVSYTCDVKPILDTRCTLSCHSPTTPSGFPYIHTYDLLQEVGDDNRLMCSITWDGCVDMPWGSGTKIDSLDIVMIAEWISQGMPE